ncbi:hypothetical protein AgCh_024863 [Apium graveolens]
MDQEVDSIVDTLLRQGSFKIWAKLLKTSKNKLVIPLSGRATMFVPTDAAHLHYTPATYPYYIPYHITPKHRLFFSHLCTLKPLSLLPTLIPSKAILITSTLPSSYKVDKAIITHPNLYLSPNIAVHGINRILDLHTQRSSVPNVLGAQTSHSAA